MDQELREYILFPLWIKEKQLELAKTYDEFMDDVIEALTTGTNRQSTLKDAISLKPRLLETLTERADLLYEKYLTKRVLHHMDAHSSIKAADVCAAAESMILETALAL